jgi:hypothetical protein
MKFIPPTRYQSRARLVSTASLLVLGIASSLALSAQGAQEVSRSLQILSQGLDENRVVASALPPPSGPVAEFLAIEDRFETETDLPEGQRQELLTQMQSLVTRIAEEERKKALGQGKDSQATSELLQKVAAMRTLRTRLWDTRLTTEEYKAIWDKLQRLKTEVAQLAANIQQPQSPQPPKLAPTHGAVSPADYFAIMQEFFDLDSARLKLKYPSADQWEKVAERCAVHCRVYDPSQLRLVGPYLHRLRLLEAESYLFASVERFKTGDLQGQLADYEKGIRLLDLLYEVKAEEVGSMPWPDDPPRQLLAMNAGVQAYDPGGNKWVKDYLDMADQFLSDFCPWGVDAWHFLRDAGFMEQFDWRILRPYGAKNVMEITPLYPLDKARIPLHVAYHANEIISGKFRAYLRKQVSDPLSLQPVTLKWRHPPEVQCRICYLSPAAFDLTTSDKINLGWKAIVLVYSGPAEVILDELQDYVVEDILSDLGETNKMYISAAEVNDMDNWGFDKSWLTEFKPQFREFKFMKSLWAYIQGTYEHQGKKLLFSGMIPPLDLLQRGNDDSRTYSRRFMPYVILRLDVSGVEDVPEDEYPRIWDVLRLYQFSPQGLTDSMKQYDLNARPAIRLTKRDAYLHGDETVHLRTWPAIPFDEKKQYGFRLMVTDFRPKAQILTITIPDDVLKSWRKEGEEVVAVLRYAKSPKPIQQPVSQVIRGAVSWYIIDKEITPADSPNLRLITCADRLRTDYVVDFIRCRGTRQDPPEFDWRNPTSKLATQEIHFGKGPVKPSGEKRVDDEGIHVLNCVYGLGPAAGPKPSARLIRYIHPIRKWTDQGVVDDRAEYGTYVDFQFPYRPVLMEVDLDKAEEMRLALRQKGDPDGNLPLERFIAEVSAAGPRGHIGDHVLEITCNGEKRFVHRAFDKSGESNTYGDATTFFRVPSGTQTVEFHITFMDKTLHPVTISHDIRVRYPPVDMRTMMRPEDLPRLEKPFKEWRTWDKEDLASSGPFAITAYVAHNIRNRATGDAGLPSAERVAVLRKTLPLWQQYYSLSGDNGKYIEGLYNLLSECTRIGNDGAYALGKEIAGVLIPALQAVPEARAGLTAGVHEQLANLAISSGNNVSAARGHLEDMLRCMQAENPDIDEELIRSGWPKRWEGPSEKMPGDTTAIQP